jgi:hypothetical protein
MKQDQYTPNSYERMRPDSGAALNTLNHGDGYTASQLNAFRAEAEAHHARICHKCTCTPANVFQVLQIEDSLFRFQRVSERRDNLDNMTYALGGIADMIYGYCGALMSELRPQQIADLFREVRAISGKRDTIQIGQIKAQAALAIEQRNQLTVAKIGKNGGGE